MANRDLYPQDFISVLAIDLYHKKAPNNVAVFERTRSGDFIGTPVMFIDGQKKIETNLPSRLKK